MRYYEITYLISPELSEEEINRFQEKINSLIRAEGGILAESKNPIKKLTYLINTKGQAYLIGLNFQLAPEKLRELEKKLKSENKILRYLILTKPRTKEILVRGKELPKIMSTKKIEKPRAKVELKEIEKKLEEILGE